MYTKYLSVLAVGAFIFNENKLLIVKKSPHERVDGGLWTIPGGKIYPKEHILDGLRREVIEEVGLEINTPVWIGEDVFSVENYMFHGEHFMCKTNSSHVVLEENLTEYRWISTVSDIESVPLPKGIKKRIIEIFTHIL